MGAMPSHHKEEGNYLYLNRPRNSVGKAKLEVAPESSVGNGQVNKAGLSILGKGASMCQDSEIWNS